MPICIPYTEKEIKRIRDLAKKGKTSEQIQKVIWKEFNTGRTLKSIARKMNEGTPHVKSYGTSYTTPKEWADAEVEYVQTHYKTESDAVMSDHLNRSTSAIQRVRNRHGWLHPEFRAAAENANYCTVSKNTLAGWKKSYIDNKFDEDTLFRVELMKRMNGTYINSKASTSP